MASCLSLLNNSSAKCLWFSLCWKILGSVKSVGILVSTQLAGSCVTATASLASAAARSTVPGAWYMLQTQTQSVSQSSSFSTKLGTSDLETSPTLQDCYTQKGYKDLGLKWLHQASQQRSQTPSCTASVKHLNASLLFLLHSRVKERCGVRRKSTQQ